ncbi:MAG TPA: PH domain-containing protein [Candidatus Saccharimonadia bacterium]
MPLDPSDMPQVPKARTIKVGDHTQEQAETLLSEPIMIPRNPVSMNVRMIVVVLFADIVFAAVFVLLIGGMALEGVTVGTGVTVTLIILLAARFTILMLVLAKMASNWAEVGYYVTDRAIIVRRGFANISENTYELGNIRHVYMFQDFMGRLYDYGHIQLVIATMGLEEKVRLTDLKNPSHYKTLFEKYLG